MIKLKSPAGKLLLLPILLRSCFATGAGIALLSLGGCAATMVATAGPLCNTVKPITTSKDDKLTRGTASEILQDNVALKKSCPYDPGRT